MDLTAAERLTDIEEKMVTAIDREWERWTNNEGPLPSSLVLLLDKAHKAIFQRTGKSMGMDLDQMMRNPEAALVELDKRKALILKFLEQRNQKRTGTDGGAMVFPFPPKPTETK